MTGRYYPHRYINYYGYVMIYKPDHIFADSRGYVREHRWIYEQYYNCCLLSFTQIHHKNGIKDDNRIENLEPTYNKIHCSKFHKKDKSNRSCLLCYSKTTWINKKGWEGWYRYENGFICNKCKCKIKNKKRGLLFYVNEVKRRASSGNIKETL